MTSFKQSVDSHYIETELKDILTINSCTTLISELIKFILYRKQQLPYTFDRLKYLITERSSKGRKKTAPNISSASIERHFKLAQDGLTTLELIFDKTKQELANSATGLVTEIALIFGSTPMTPKQVYRIHLPQIALAHSSLNHPDRKHLIHLLHSVIFSNSLCTMLGEPMNPTNMFLFIRKTLKRTCTAEESMSDWFIPKNRYDIPHTGQHFHIKLTSPEGKKCGCEGVSIYSDEREGLVEAEEQSAIPEATTREATWYQACAVFKGFTDAYIDGVSVADLWLRERTYLPPRVSCGNS